MEMNAVTQKGFEIEPRVWPLACGTFGIPATIWEHTGPTSIVHEVDARNTYPEQEKAQLAAAAIATARQGIDVELPGMAV
jgi:hypothetical protein